MKICKYCQSEINENAKVCPICKKQVVFSIGNVIIGVIIAILLLILLTPVVITPVVMG